MINVTFFWYEDGRTHTIDWLVMSVPQECDEVSLDGEVFLVHKVRHIIDTLAPVTAQRIMIHLVPERIEVEVAYNPENIMDHDHPGWSMREWN